MSNRAFVTGVTGQDGHYLSKLLLDKGYDVFGLVRRISGEPKIPEGVIPVCGDITDPKLINKIENIEPEEIYNLAAMSHVGNSFESPTSTFQINAIGAINVLEAARLCRSKFYQASTSELFGISDPPQSEKTPFHPRSPYGVSKIAAYWATVNYREAYGLYACNGILFNHESPLRGHNFVTQKVCTGVARIVRGKQKFIELGNLSAVRDWGHAEDYVNGMWLMMQQEVPDDYVLATGTCFSVEDLVKTAFSVLGISNWQDYVVHRTDLERPSEVPVLRGDPSKAIEELGWEIKHSFESIIEEMVMMAYKREGS